MHSFSTLWETSSWKMFQDPAYTFNQRWLYGAIFTVVRTNGSWDEGTEGEWLFSLSEPNNFAGFLFLSQQLWASLIYRADSPKKGMFPQRDTQWFESMRSWDFPLAILSMNWQAKNLEKKLLSGMIDWSWLPGDIKSHYVTAQGELWLELRKLSGYLNACMLNIKDN